ncbi:MAG TPA: YihA family ribosome biogenesis GTP-binding protein [Ruminococcaceae bacterium]|nr:YihA family ribosome biogenesis GTP-binding protein [Oscillospiraceae bacterium]
MTDQNEPFRIKKVEYIASAGAGGGFPEAEIYPEIAVVGRSNVGKSTLINTLCRRNIARTSKTPGKTRRIHYFLINDSFYLVDLPGYGYAKVSHSEKARWAKLMEHYFESDRNLALVIQLLDMRHPPTKDDISMLDFLDKKQIPFIITLTKCDKLKKSERARRLAALPEELSFLSTPPVMIPFSSLTGEGVQQVRAEIEKALEDCSYEIESSKIEI